MNGRMPMRSDDFAQTVVRMVLQSMNNQSRGEFIRRMTADFAPEVQCRLYLFVKEMIRSWAGNPVLSNEDAGVIEDSRKICDVMGWAPASWIYTNERNI
jgi:hypothetical protein